MKLLFVPCFPRFSRVDGSRIVYQSFAPSGPCYSTVSPGKLLDEHISARILLHQQYCHSYWPCRALQSLRSADISHLPNHSTAAKDGIIFVWPTFYRIKFIKNRKVKQIEKEKYCQRMFKHFSVSWFSKRQSGLL